MLAQRKINEGAELLMWNPEKVERWKNDRSAENAESDDLLWETTWFAGEPRRVPSEYQYPGERGWYSSTGFVVEADGLTAYLVSYAHQENKLECLRDNFCKVSATFQWHLTGRTKYWTKYPGIQTGWKNRMKVMDRWIIYLTEMINHDSDSLLLIRDQDGECKVGDVVVAEQAGTGRFYTAVYESDSENSDRQRTNGEIIKCKMCDNGEILDVPAENVSKALDFNIDFSILCDFENLKKDEAWKKLVDVINQFDKYQILVLQKKIRQNLYWTEVETSIYIPRPSDKRSSVENDEMATYILRTKSGKRQNVMLFSTEIANA